MWVLHTWDGHVHVRLIHHPIPTRRVRHCKGQKGHSRWAIIIIRDVDDIRYPRVVGNLCRCTGYRPILQAFKGLCGTGDVEDLMKGKRDNEELIEPARIITNNRKEGLAEIEVAIVRKQRNH